MPMRDMGSRIAGTRIRPVSRPDPLLTHDARANVNICARFQPESASRETELAATLATLESMGRVVATGEGKFVLV
ncbi:MAG: hypothetical protein QM599_02095 [Pseudoxanthomonas sp.]